VNDNANSLNTGYHSAIIAARKIIVRRPGSHALATIDWDATYAAGYDRRLQLRRRHRHERHHHLRRQRRCSSSARRRMPTATASTQRAGVPLHVDDQRRRSFVTPS
jgi:hypothetical protein